MDELVVLVRLSTSIPLTVMVGREMIYEVNLVEAS